MSSSGSVYFVVFVLYLNVTLSSCNVVLYPNGRENEEIKYMIQMRNSWNNDPRIFSELEYTESPDLKIWIENDPANNFFGALGKNMIESQVENIADSPLEHIFLTYARLVFGSHGPAHNAGGE